jgi:hypothetical protein
VAHAASSYSVGINTKHNAILQVLNVISAQRTVTLLEFYALHPVNNHDILRCPFRIQANQIIVKNRSNAYISHHSKQLRKISFFSGDSILRMQGQVHQEQRQKYPTQ